MNNYVSNEIEAIEALNNILSDMKSNIKAYALNDETSVEDLLKNLDDPNRVYDEDENTIEVCVDFDLVNKDDELYSVSFGANEGVWMMAKINKSDLTVRDFNFDEAVDTLNMNN